MKLTDWPSAHAGWRESHRNRKWMESGSLKFSLLSVMYETRLLTQGYISLDLLCFLYACRYPNNDQST